MAITDHIYLQGKAKWARFTQPDQYGNWSVVLYPNDEGYTKIMELKDKGLMNVIKKDDDGYYCTFRRPQSKTYSGKVKGFAPPMVLDGTQKLSDGSHPPLVQALVGNGSDVTLHIEVYPFKKPGGGSGVGARLVSCRVDNLVPYTGRQDFAEDQQRTVNLQAEAPSQPLF